MKKFIITTLKGEEITIEASSYSIPAAGTVLIFMNGKKTVAMFAVQNILSAIAETE